MVNGVIRVLVAVLVGTLAGAQEANAQWAQQPATIVNLDGPRLGATFLSPGVQRDLEDRGIEIGPVISQFGWQKEKQFLSHPGGFTGVTEFVLLAGGLDQGVLLPSLNWLVGMRTASGFEFAVGPNVTAAGVALALAGGVTFKAGDLNIPVNLAFVPSKSGARVSMLVGFNMRRP